MTTWNLSWASHLAKRVLTIGIALESPSPLESESLSLGTAIKVDLELACKHEREGVAVQFVSILFQSFQLFQFCFNCFNFVSIVSILFQLFQFCSNCFI